MMQYALVAGGSKGIGYTIAVALAKRNYNLILVGRQDRELDRSLKLDWKEEKIQV